jgi:hypothetical protein
MLMSLERTLKSQHLRQRAPKRFRSHVNRNVSRCVVSHFLPTTTTRRRSDYRSVAFLLLPAHTCACPGHTQVCAGSSR